MQKINNKSVLRIIDANFNRAKEGLRVCEDICRFILDDKKLTQEYKSVRHLLSDIILRLGILKVIDCRNIEGDCGKVTSFSEMKRSTVADIYFANSQRVKESIRVLEEFTKLLNLRFSVSLKKLRYKIYAIEKKIITRI